MNIRRILVESLFYITFAFYLIVLFALLFLKVQAFSAVNFVPFASISLFLWSEDPVARAFAVFNVVGNIVLFVPLGLYLPILLRQHRIVKNVLFIAIISASVEVLQFIFRVGVTDIDDVLLNTGGGFIGVVGYRMLYKVFQDAQKVRLAVTFGAPIAAIICVVSIIIYNR